MTSEKLIELFEMYYAILSPAQRLREDWYNKPYRVLASFNDVVPTVQGHLAWMSSEAKNFVKEGRIQKAMRWLGFIQFGMWQLGLRSLEQLKEDSKPAAGEENAPNAVDLSAELAKKEEELWAVIKAAEDAGWNGVENSKILPEFIRQLGEYNEYARGRLRAIYEALDFVTDHGPDLDTFVDGHADALAPSRIRGLKAELERWQNGTPIEGDYVRDHDLRQQARIDQLMEENGRLKADRQLRKWMMWGYGCGVSAETMAKGVKGITKEEAEKLLVKFREEYPQLSSYVEQRTASPTTVINKKLLHQLRERAIGKLFTKESELEALAALGDELRRRVVASDEDEELAEFIVEEVNRILGRVDLYTTDFETSDLKTGKPAEPLTVECDYAELEMRVLANMSDEAVQDFYGRPREDVLADYTMEIKRLSSMLSDLGSVSYPVTVGLLENRVLSTPTDILRAKEDLEVRAAFVDVQDRAEERRSSSSFQATSNFNAQAEAAARMWPAHMASFMKVILDNPKTEYPVFLEDTHEIFDTPEELKAAIEQLERMSPTGRITEDKRDLSNFWVRKTGSTLEGIDMEEERRLMNEEEAERSKAQDD